MINKTLFLIGSGIIPDETDFLFQRLFNLVGGASKVKLGIIAESTYEDVVSVEYLTSDLLNCGLVNSQIDWININDNNKNSPEIVSRIKTRNIFYFTGGSQDRQLFGVLYDGLANDERFESLALKTIRQLIDSGQAIYAGHSAGTMLSQGDVLIVGGDSYEALINGSYDVKDNSAGDADLILDYEGGLSFFNYGTIDSHFAYRGRQGRLIRTIVDSKNRFGFGIDNVSAALIKITDTTATMECIGTGIHIIDDIEVSIPSNNPKKISNLKMHRLSNGDIYNLILNTITYRGKRLVTGRERIKQIRISNDILSSSMNKNENGERANPDEWDKIVKELLLSIYQSTTGYSFEQPQVKIVFTKKQNTRVYARIKNKNVENYSYENLYVDIILP